MTRMETAVALLLWAALATGAALGLADNREQLVPVAAGAGSLLAVAAVVRAACALASCGLLAPHPGRHVRTGGDARC